MNNSKNNLKDLSGLRRVTEKEQKNVMLDILNKIHSFCVDNGIEYCLAYGTLLGAVRHKGFIPWDDDVDIVMTRENYNKFIRTFNTNRADDYTVVSVENDEDYYMLAAKVYYKKTILRERIYNPIDIGVYVDVFPVDTLSNDYNTAKKTIDRIQRLYRPIMLMSIEKRDDRSFIKRVVYNCGMFILKFIDRRKQLVKINKVAQSYSAIKDSTYSGAAATSIYGVKEIVESVWYKEIVEMEFEGKMYYAPKEYDKILTHFYGDYMTPPPIDKQITHHSFDAFWVD